MINKIQIDEIFKEANNFHSSSTRVIAIHFSLPANCVKRRREPGTAQFVIGYFNTGESGTFWRSFFLFFFFFPPGLEIRVKLFIIPRPIVSEATVSNGLWILLLPTALLLRFASRGIFDLQRRVGPLTTSRVLLLFFFPLLARVSYSTASCDEN